MKKNIKWIICIISLTIFLILGYLVKTNNELILDGIVYSFISKFINNNMTNIIKVVTYLGSATVVILITILALIVLKNKLVNLV